jgi:hypothetical protein
MWARQQKPTIRRILYCVFWSFCPRGEGSEVSRFLALVAAVAASLAVAVPSSTATTSPGYNFKIDVFVTDTGVTLSRSVAKRGWLAHFVVHNRGTKVHVFNIGGLKTKPIPPGKQGKVGAYLDVRGQYVYRVDNKTRGHFTVT